ncbi:hypothetical protein K440DRAFT_642500 [Wilcoxina mikolae CBS 423.85]|nr:hypothetical protein K440DRAFT_642500 [Wilcoxina mikolae CBS 423.85]
MNAQPPSTTTVTPGEWAQIIIGVTGIFVMNREAHPEAEIHELSWLGSNQSTCPERDCEEAREAIPTRHEDGWQLFRRKALHLDRWCKEALEDSVAAVHGWFDNQ